jgi:two-component system, OmpR family, response regulator PhoP
MRILLVEDEAALRNSLQAELRAAGHAVDIAADGTEGLYAALEFPLDVAIVDLGLPGVPGLELIRRLRAAGRSYGVLVLTARDRWEDKVEGLAAGADDYLTKPFHAAELLARLGALLRRTGRWSSPLLQCGPLMIDTRAQVVTMDGAAVELTSFEYRVLKQLVLHAGEVLSKSDLNEKLYEHDHERDSNVIEVLIARLRRKLDPGDALHPIETLRGRGYRLAFARGGD